LTTRISEESGLNTQCQRFASGIGVLVGDTIKVWVATGIVLVVSNRESGWLVSVELTSMLTVEDSVGTATGGLTSALHAVRNKIKIDKLRK
jgi:hypothetical protein